MVAPFPNDVDPGDGRLILATIRSHDQFNTSIYSNDDRYRGLKGLRTIIFMNEQDMQDRALDEWELVDITTTPATERPERCTATAPFALRSRPATPGLRARAKRPLRDR